ncbi:hypothetical protein [Neptunicella sp.]|uniref:hypothetical protein n=1 Tax=Neptunicella sp. TaxID=2125986 RepID=UPI003F68DBBF
MKKIISTILIFLACSLPSRADDTAILNILGMEYTGSVQANQQGAFDMMLLDFMRQLELPFRYDIVNAARGYRLFTQKKADCLLPSVDYLPYFNNLNIINSSSFAMARHVAFTLQGEPITSPQQLQDKVVGIIRDDGTWDYKKRIPSDDIIWLGLNNLNTLAAMLEKGRIDVAIHDRDDYLAFIRQHNMRQPIYSGEHPMWQDNVVITCHNTPSNQAFIKQLEPLIDDVRQSQKLVKYYRKAIELAEQ